LKSYFVDWRVKQDPKGPVVGFRAETPNIGTESSSILPIELGSTEAGYQFIEVVRELFIEAPTQLFEFEPFLRQKNVRQIWDIVPFFNRMDV
jgi:hypothetical protein